MNRSGSSQNWKQIGVIQSQSLSCLKSLLISQGKSKKFQAHSHGKSKKDSTRKTFKMSDKIKNNTLKNNQKTNICKGKLNFQERESMCQLTGSHWKQDQSTVKQGLSILGKVGLYTDRFLSESQNQSIEVQNRGVRKDQMKAINSIQQQFNKFKNDIIKQLKQVQQQMDIIIHQVMTRFDRQMENLKKQKIITEIKMREKQTQITPFQSEIATSKRNKLKTHLRVNTQYQLHQIDTPIQSLAQKSEEGFSKILKKQQFKKFRQAIQRLKTDIQYTNQTNLKFNANYISTHDLEYNRLK